MDMQKYFIGAVSCTESIAFVPSCMHYLYFSSDKLRRVQEEFIITVQLHLEKYFKAYVHLYIVGQ